MSAKCFRNKTRIQRRETERDGMNVRSTTEENDGCVEG